MTPKEETPAVSGGSHRDVVKLVAAVAALGAALGMRPDAAGAQVMKQPAVSTNADAQAQDKNWGDKQSKVGKKGEVATKAAAGGAMQMKITKDAIGGAVSSKGTVAGGAVTSKGAVAGGAVQMKEVRAGVGGAAAAKGAIIGPLDSKKAPAGGAVAIKMNNVPAVKP